MDESRIHGRKDWKVSSKLVCEEDGSSFQSQQTADTCHFSGSDDHQLLLHCPVSVQVSGIKRKILTECNVCDDVYKSSNHKSKSCNLKCLGNTQVSDFNHKDVYKI